MFYSIKEMIITVACAALIFFVFGYIFTSIFPIPVDSLITGQNIVNVSSSVNNATITAERINKALIEIKNRDFGCFYELNKEPLIGTVESIEKNKIILKIEPATQIANADSNKKIINVSTSTIVKFIGDSDFKAYYLELKDFEKKVNERKLQNINPGEIDLSSDIRCPLLNRVPADFSDIKVGYKLNIITKSKDWSILENVDARRIRIMLPD